MTKFLRVGLYMLSALLAAPSAFSQDTVETVPFYKMINTMQINDSAGIGIEMVFQADTLPEGGLTGPTLIRDMEVLCKTWAQQVITHVVTQTKMQPPAFLSVMIRSGGMFGLYARQRFSTDGEQCLSRGKS